MTVSANNSAEASEERRAASRAFIVGGVIPSDRGVYLPRQTDAELFRLVVAGEYAHVLAPRQSGKSSLTARIADRLREREHLVAVVDISQIGMRQDDMDSARWFYSYAFRLVRQLRLRVDLQDWWQDKATLTNRQRLTELYWDLILANTTGPVTIFVDSPGPFSNLPYADDLLASIRSVHNARAAEPELARLNFVLLSVGDSGRSKENPDLRLLAGSESIVPQPFGLNELRPLRPFVAASTDSARRILKRIHFWTGGQPFLTLKLARGVARNIPGPGDEANAVDRIVRQLFGHPGVMHSEPHLNAIQQAMLFESGDREQILTLYGKVRKGGRIAFDPDSVAQRTLLDEGVLRVGGDQTLVVANRIYALAFTTRWVNEHLDLNIRAAAAALLAIAFVFVLPYWYSQVLPSRWSEKIATAEEISVATDAHERMRAWPGHRRQADQLLADKLVERSRASADLADVTELNRLLRELPGTGSRADELLAGYWDREARRHENASRRDEALVARLNAYQVATVARRNAVVALLDDDEEALLLSARFGSPIDAARLSSDGAFLVTQHGLRFENRMLGTVGAEARKVWEVHALKTAQIVRRLAVDARGKAGRIRLDLSVQHDRPTDLLLRLTAPSGRSVAFSGDAVLAAGPANLRFDAAATSELRELQSESIEGNWTLSVVDRLPAISGMLDGWQIRFGNGQVMSAVAEQAILPNPQPDSDALAIMSPSGRYVVALPASSEGMAQVWEASNQQPISVFPFSPGDQLLGFVTDERVVMVATATGIRAYALATGEPSWAPDVAGLPVLTALAHNREFLAIRSSENANEPGAVEVFDLIEAKRSASFVTGGDHQALAVSNDGQQVALADPDRTVRVWRAGNARPEFEFPVSAVVRTLAFDSGGDALLITTDAGGLWWRDLTPTAEHRFVADADGWQVAFGDRGRRAVAGNAATGYRAFEQSLLQPLSGLMRPGTNADDYQLQVLHGGQELLMFSTQDRSLRVYRLPDVPDEGVGDEFGYSALSGDGKRVVAEVRPGELWFGSSDELADELDSARREIGFVGHRNRVTRVRFSESGELAVSAAIDGTVRVWNTDTGEPRPYFLRIASSHIDQFALSPDERWLVLADEGRVRLIDLATGNAVGERITAEGRVTALEFAEDSRSVFAGLTSGSVWKLSVGTDLRFEVRHFSDAPVSALAIRDASIAVAFADGNLAVLDEWQAAAETSTVAGEACRELRWYRANTRLICRGASWVREFISENNQYVAVRARLLPARRLYAGLNLPKGRQEYFSVLAAAPLPEVRKIYWDRRDVVTARLEDDLDLQAFRTRLLRLADSAGP